MTGVQIGDVVRTIVIVEAIVVAGAMTSVLRLYGRAWRRRKVRGSGPRAVMLMSASYAMIAGLLGLGIFDNLGEAITWRIPCYGVGLFVGLLALRLYARDERQARRALRLVVPDLDADPDDALDGEPVAGGEPWVEVHPAQPWRRQWCRRSRRDDRTSGRPDVRMPRDQDEQGGGAP